MSRIVCAIRGGGASRTTVSRALALAKTTGFPLTFLYVVNPDLTQTVSTDQADAAAERIRQMGQSVLLTAQALANSQGIRAQGIVRHGSVAGEIARTCRELDAEYLVLSPPGTREDEGYFTPSLLTQFVSQIEKRSGINVILSE
jgi:nucleotide-binding universal stress UspA family protein